MKTTIKNIAQSSLQITFTGAHMICSLTAKASSKLWDKTFDEAYTDMEAKAFITEDAISGFYTRQRQNISRRYDRADKWRKRVQIKAATKMYNNASGLKVKSLKVA